MEIVGAGTFGAPVKDWTPGFPLQYNLLTFQSNVVTVHTRKRPDVDGAWVPDAVWPPEDGGNPVPRYQIVLRRTVSTQIEEEEEGIEGPDKPPDGPCEEEVLKSEIADYGEKAASFYERIDMVGFRTRVRAPIRVEEIYIPLNAAVDTRHSGKACFSDSKDAAKCLEEAGAGKPISLPDAFLTSEKLGRRGIVLLGDPGSGKTTHLKRTMLWCLRGGLARLGLPEDLVPVFLPLRDLKDLDGNLGRFIQSQLANPQWDVKPDFGERLMKRGRLLFLFDGLDEVADTRERERVARLIEETLRLDPKKTNRFVVTCRFAGYTPETRLDEEFLELHIRDLTEDQSEEFVRTWYRLVEEGLSEDREQARIAASEGARDLIDRLRQKEFRAARVMELTRNPCCSPTFAWCTGTGADAFPKDAPGFTTSASTCSWNCGGAPKSSRSRWRRTRAGESCKPSPTGFTRRRTGPGRPLRNWPGSSTRSWNSWGNPKARPRSS